MSALLTKFLLGSVFVIQIRMGGSHLLIFSEFAPWLASTLASFARMRGRSGEKSGTPPLFACLKTKNSSSLFVVLMNRMIERKSKAACGLELKSLTDECVLVKHRRHPFVTPRLKTTVEMEREMVTKMSQSSCAAFKTSEFDKILVRYYLLQPSRIADMWHLKYHFLSCTEADPGSKGTAQQPNATPLTKLKRRHTVPSPTAPHPCIKKSGLASSFNAIYHQKKRSSVKFAPLPPPSKPKQAKQQPTSKGFRGDYSLGDAVRSPSHMIVQASTEKAFHSVSSLEKHDFAFVKRADGTFVYSILAFRSWEQSGDKSDPASSLEEYLAFVTSDAGSIERLKKDQWNERVRLVSTDTDVSSSHKATQQDEGWMPPNIISFTPPKSQDDDLSVLGIPASLRGSQKTPKQRS